MKILYHGNCYDGFGAAWAAWTKFGTTAEYVPVTYGQPVPELEHGEFVYLVDFSYDRETILRLREFRDVVVIDHHKTAEKALAGLDNTVFDLDHSGAVLTWQYFHPDRLVPRLLQYIEDRDLWRFDLPHSHEVHAWHKSHRYDFHGWVECSTKLQHDFEACVAEGVGILRFQTRMVEMICDQAYDGTVGDHEVPVVNATAFWSEVGHELLERYPDAPFVVSYFDRADGRRQYSLRSRDDFDCSEVAEAMGGGGHPRAAGFEVKRL